MSRVFKLMPDRASNGIGRENHQNLHDNDAALSHVLKLSKSEMLG
jgi:hypothetical protein